MKNYKLWLNNSEFTRNIWQECTVQRLIAIPVILGLIVALIKLGTSAMVANGVLVILGGWGFALVVICWGSHLATSTLMQEFSEGTWDSQRMSGLTPAQVLWGKLFGGTVVAWYAGGMLLAVLLYGVVKILAIEDIPASEKEILNAYMWKGLVVLVLLAIMIHAMSMSSLLAIWRKRNRQWGKGMRGVAITPVVFIVVIFWFMSNGIFRSPRMGGWSQIGQAYCEWFGMQVSWANMTLLILISLTVWMLIGLWQQIRTELQFRNSPWWWVGFLLFWMVVLAGFGGADWRLQGVFQSSWYLYWLMCTCIVLGTVYIQLFYERKDAMTWLRFFNAAKRKEKGRLASLFPAWASSYLMAVVLAGVFVLWGVQGYGSSVQINTSLALAVVSTLFFVLRDVALVLWLNLAVKNQRADAAAILYLLVLYLLMPWLTSLVLGGNAQFLFLPLMRDGYRYMGSMLFVLAPLVQAVVMLGLLWQRWQVRKGKMLD